MSSPWGKIDHVTIWERGISFVGTPSHGGVRVAKGYAERKLSAECRSRAIDSGAYLFFEEDCDYALPLWELPHLWAKANVTRESLLSSLSAYNPGYLIARGVVPLEPNYTQWKLRQEDDRMRREKHPDLIVCAQTDAPGVVKVMTADQKWYRVTKESYDARVHRRLNLLSECILVLD